MQDRAAPFHSDAGANGNGGITQMCVPTIGDLRSTSRESFEVKAGEITPAETACDEPVLATG